MKTINPSYVHDVEPMAKLAMPVQAEAGQAPTGITDVLTIAEEGTVFRRVQRSLRPEGWAVAHSNSLDAAVVYLRSNVAAVAIAEAELADNDLRTLVSCLSIATDGPEVVLITWDKVPLRDALRAGAFDVVERPFDDSELLWAIATAWHSWMTRRERTFGGVPCSDA